MALYKPSMSLLFTLLFVVLVLPSFCHAFGAGNIASISRVEGQNWRHGDIEDILAEIVMAKVAGGKKFSKLNIARTYFGNFLRDYSQAIDVGTVKKVSPNAIRIIVWVLSFLSFGYGTREFEVTQERLGCYRPEEHIDNPKDYADNVDARQYYPKLRGPVNEQVELSIDERSGLKKYIASEDKGITTSAGLIRDLFGRSVYLGRQYARTKDKADLHEALRLLGTGCHCLEDFSAHSNYTELALRNCGEGDIFPHVGRNTALSVHGVDHPVYPVVTGTFGGVDFLHSVMGELDDHATQSEVQELEGTIKESQNRQNPEAMKNILHQMPRGVFGGADEAAKADELQANAVAVQMRGLNVSPRDGQAWEKQLDDIAKQIYPILEYHDRIFMSIDKFMEHIPILPGLIDKLKEQVNMFVFSLLAPLVLPVIQQVKQQLSVGSSEVIQISKQKQFLVFTDDYCTDPTHSMLSKDHFSNVLNEPAGKVAAQVLKWVVPQLMQCWDSESIDVNSTLNRIISGVFHHPALRNSGQDGARECRQLMFQVVEKWWREKTESQRGVLRSQLSREGVEQGHNHKAGVNDSGHGSCKPGGHVHGAPSTGMARPPNSVPGGLSPGVSAGGGRRSSFQKIQDLAAGAIVGGPIGGLLSGFVGGGGSGTNGPSFQQQPSMSSSSHNSSYAGASHQYAGYGQSDTYGQAQSQHTTHPSDGYEANSQHYGEPQYGQHAGYDQSVNFPAAGPYGSSHSYGQYPPDTQATHRHEPPPQYGDHVGQYGAQSSSMSGSNTGYPGSGHYGSEKHDPSEYPAQQGWHDSTNVGPHPPPFGGPPQQWGPPPPQPAGQYDHSQQPGAAYGSGAYGEERYEGQQSANEGSGGTYGAGQGYGQQGGGYGYDGQAPYGRDYR